MFIAKEKALYQNLNMMKWQSQSFIGYFWAPLEEETKIRASLHAFQAAKIDGYDNHSITKPTYFKTNAVTEVFQAMVDQYGVPTYLEANPALLSIVTFPFLFGMMFGDMGHGSILLIFATVLVLGHDSIKDTVLSSFSSIRYLLLLMGIFATYCGFIYNEFFAM